MIPKAVGVSGLLLHPTRPVDQASAPAISLSAGLSIATFLMAPEIFARSGMVALVPSRRVRNRSDRLRIINPLLPVAGFTDSRIWHDRTTAPPAQRRLRDKNISLA
jgi:hypothetical protein